MKKSLKTVERRMAVQLVVSRGCSVPLRVRLRYEPTDPYVVRAAFFVDGDEPVEWTLGRELLADGLKGSAGYADVRIWAAPGRGDQSMYITLGSSAGTALLEVPVRDLTSFLQSTEALVPRGTESGHIDWDVELAHLLARG
ncbi:SsgA family sporulation/cell division regulator [Streptomyces sp. NPDC056683]|uniref:SsgA family sporulation/cell division regulator n=1 Tax=Streptomyces sp. NPDC056683 TaxID=3345910 RepID=UPI0036B001E3